ncbi:nitrite reductase [Streptomonospora alba]|uniref:Nitrite reductase n=1 Tax=Streptomonospora alba TaxID=183763 RepID=A0A0C2G446_9ACTN|nr:molybdopterin oxidoreductase family protein [Streptomonospora alba]KIH98033.1 nitrite reductase [Streptomonospora alba]
MTVTHCPYCALQCAMRLTPAPQGGLSVRPVDFPTNRGGLCRKGWTAAELLRSPERLTRPLLRIRRSAPLREVDWETALDHVAARLGELRTESGSDAVGVFGGGGLTNEKAYLLGKFARLALGTSRIDYNGRFCMSSAAAAGTRAFGVDRGLPFPLPDLAGAEVVLLAGANPAATMPPMMGHLASPRLIVADPRRSETAARAEEGGGLHLAPRPGTDAALAMGLLHSARKQGLLDEAYIAERTTGFTAALRQAAAWWPERTEHVTGVAAADIRTAADMLGTACGAYVLTGRGVEQHSTGTATAGWWINLALGLGLPGRRGSGYGTITGQGNGQGGREHGQKADQLPGYRSIGDPRAREHVAKVWGVEPDELPGPGPSAQELLESLGRPEGPRGLVVMGSNPAVSAPDSDRVRERLGATEFLVVSDFVLSETAALADVVLPSLQWAEEEGTLTSLEGRILCRRAVAEPPEGPRSDLRILSELARRLGQSAARFPAEPEAVLSELAAASAGGPADYAGLSPDRLAGGEALYWPLPDSASSTPRLFLDGFHHPDGRARFHSGGLSAPDEAPDAEFPLLATTGRLLNHYQSGAQTRRVPELAEAAPEAEVQVHPDSAHHYGMSEGEWVRVVSRRGRMLARLRLNGGIRRDTVFLPFHYSGEQAANKITNPALDPVSRMPEFKLSAVRLETCASGADPA